MRTDYSFYDLNNNLDPTPVRQSPPRDFDAVFRQAANSLRRSRERRAANLGITYDELVALELQIAYGELDKEDVVF